jgi:hypothetical protein
MALTAISVFGPVDMATSATGQWQTFTTGSTKTHPGWVGGATAGANDLLWRTAMGTVLTLFSQASTTVNAKILRLIKPLG